MSIIDHLMGEHEHIKKMLSFAQIISTQLELCPEEATIGHLEKVVDFMQGFTGSFHHRKEEELLFTAMQKSHVTLDTSQIKIMLEEHMLGRQLISKMNAIFDKIRLGQIQATTELLTVLHQYITLVNDHIKKEEQSLYPLANSYLSNLQKQDIMTKFESMDQSSSKNLDVYMNLLDELHLAYGHRLPCSTSSKISA